MTRTLDYQFLGRRHYEPVLQYQLDLAESLRVETGQVNDHLLLVEHEPVITIGRKGSESDVLVDRAYLERTGLTVVHVDRGGEVTYHGPGQLVIYPILHVKRGSFYAADLVRGLADSIAHVLSQYGVETTYSKDNPGLWVEGAKICAVGMRISRGVSTHGAAVNVSTDLDAFKLIVPCGKTGARSTSLVEEMGNPHLLPENAQLALEIAERFSGHFEYKLRLTESSL